MMRFYFHSSYVVTVTLFLSLTLNQSVCGQAGLRESLERLDRNENGEIDPEEITPLARPYLERITKERRIRLDRSVEIDRLQEAARIYYALKNGVAGTRVRPSGESSVKRFGEEDDEPMVPQFGLAEVKYPYTQDDLEEADETLERSDRNEDGYIDRREASRARWTHRNPFDDDLDKDGRLSRLELGQRYARRRLLEGASDELVRKAIRTGSEVRNRNRDDDADKDGNEWWRRGGNTHWLTASMMGRFDSNKNGRLEFREAQQTGLPVGRADLDRDGEITRDELFALVGELQEEAGNVTEGLPGWFYELDADRDGQVEMAEFTTDWTDEKYREFEMLDENSDGLLTADEVLKSSAVTGGSYRNEDAIVLSPRKTVISEIDVQDDYLIRDLNVQISITHSHDGFLDAYLTGPDGQRIELFSEVGGGGDHFDQTIFDDQSGTPINKAQAPFEGRFRPHGLEKRQPGLSSFNGKSVKGVWQLVVRGTRSDRFGMLHSWGMTVVPQEDSTIGADIDSGKKDAEPEETSSEKTGQDAVEGIKKLFNQ